MRERSYCGTCGKYHLGHCLSRTKARFKCEQEEHKLMDALMGLLGLFKLKERVHPSKGESLPLLDERSRE